MKSQLATFVNSRSGGNSVATTTSYTGGRWLKNERLQMQVRTSHFNFESLCRRALKVSPGARSIVHTEKKEGGFNRVFLFTLDTGTTVVAKLPFSHTGPPKLTTHSEVATIAYLRRHIPHVPLPEILDWGDSSTDVEKDFIIMKHVPGIQLQQRWPSMNKYEHVCCTTSIIKFVRDVSKLQFPGYGSIYFADAPIISSAKLEMEDGFCLGPLVGYPTWPCNPSNLSGSLEKLSQAGPWTDLMSYSNHLVNTGLSKLPDKLTQPKLPWWGDVEEHRILLQAARDVLASMAQTSQIRALAAPMLLHPDLHARNIYVDAADPAKITAFIDWQCASVAPTFLYADEMPDFVVPHDNNMTNDDSDNASVKDNSIDSCRQTWDIGTRGYMPRLFEARYGDPRLLRAFDYSASSWQNSIMLLRQSLIDLSSSWTELGFTGSCPYRPSQTELETQANHFPFYNAAQDLREDLYKALRSNSEGWVHTDDWEVTRKNHITAWQMYMDNLAEPKDPEMIQYLRDIWPYDIPE